MPRDVDPGLYRGVWVYVDHDDGEAAPVSWELVGAGRGLADRLDTEVSAVVIGGDVQALAEEAFSHGAARVFAVDHPLVSPYRLAVHATALSGLVEAHRPEILLLGATMKGRELSASVATAVAGGLTADVTELSLDSENRLLEATRPTFGGKQMATIVCRRWRPQMATVRPRVLPIPERVDGGNAPIIYHDVDLAPSALVTSVLERTEIADDSDRLQEAEVIVAGGRGLGEGRNFALLHELASVLGGVVAASRAAVDSGWIDRACQIGQTGVTVRPRLYFAIGISGAIQHTVGIKDADLIVAVNRDEKAPIFEVADLGIAGDLFTVVPALTEEFRLRLNRSAARGAGGDIR